MFMLPLKNLAREELTFEVYWLDRTAAGTLITGLVFGHVKRFFIITEYPHVSAMM